MRKFGLAGLVGLLLLTMASTVAMSPANAQDTTSTAFLTRIKFVNAFTAMDAIDVYINDDRVIEDLKFGEVSDWFDTEAGTVRVTFKNERTGFDYAIYDAYYPIPAGNSYQLVITDVFIIPSVTELGPLEEGMARVRLLHGSIETPTIDVLSGTDAQPIVTNMAYGQASEYVEIPAGTYSFNIVAAGTTESAAMLNDMVIEAGKVYDFVLAGKINSTDFPLQVVTSVTAVEITAAATPTA